MENIIAKEDFNLGSIAIRKGDTIQILETYESEKEIRRLLPTILDILFHSIDTVLDYNKEAIRQYGSAEQALKNRVWELSITTPDKVLEKNISEFVKPWLKAWSKRRGTIKLIMGYHPSLENTRGALIDEVDIIVVVPTSRHLINILKTFVFDGRPYREVEKSLKLLLEKEIFASSLVHELTHSYDVFRSQGKFSFDYIHPDVSKSGYLKHPSEVNARFSQVILELEKHFTKFLGNFDEAEKALKLIMENWKELSEAQQKRLLKRLWNWFTTLEEDEIETGKCILTNLKAYELLDGMREGKSPNSIKLEIPQNLRHTVLKSIDFKNEIKKLLKELEQGKFDFKALRYANITTNKYYHIIKILGYSLIESNKAITLLRSGQGDNYLNNIIRKESEFLSEVEKYFNVNIDRLSMAIQTILNSSKVNYFKGD